MAYAGLPQGAVVDEQPRYAGLPPGATVNVPADEPQTIGGGAQVSSPTPLQDVTIVPEGPVPELRAAPSQAAINVHNVAHGALPWLGLATGEIAGGIAAGPGGMVVGGGVGFAAGKAKARGVDEAIGFRPLREEDATTNAERFLRDTREGLVWSTGSGLVTAAGKGVLGAVTARAKPDFALNNVLRKGYEKAVRPTTVGKRSAPKIQQAFTRFGDSVKSIIKNKQILQYTDDAGNVVASGRFPRTLNEFSQAIHQTKRKILEEYTGLAMSAGDKGARVNLVPIADDIGALALRKDIQDQAPKAAKHALEVADTMARRGSLTPIELQDQLVHVNRRLKSWYSRGAGTEEQVLIDTELAHLLRKALNEAVDAAVGPGYPALKLQWGGLTSVEGEVAKRAGVSGRQGRSITQFIEDIASAGHAARAIVSGDPVAATTVAAVKTVGRFHRAANDPNKIISKMFENAEKIIVKGEGRSAFAESATRIGGRLAESRGVPKVEPPPTAEQQAVAKVPLDTPTFQRRGTQIRPTDLSGEMAQGHRPYLAENPAEVSARTFRAQLPATPAAESAAAFEKAGLGRAPQPPRPGQVFAAEKLKAFEGISMLKKSAETSAAVRARVVALVNSGGPQQVGLGMARPAAPRWVRKEVAAMLPDGTPEGIIRGYVNAAMGRK